MRLRRLATTAPGFEAALAALVRFAAAQDEAVAATVRDILARVRAEGDRAVLAYTWRLDGVRADTLADLEIPRRECEAALARLPGAQAHALRVAAERIRRFHERQRAASWEYREADGTRLGQLVRPLARVGLYVPGGTAAYPSTVLMNAIPAKVAGVPELVMTTPTPRGERNALVLAAAALAGVDRVYAIGGAQAIAALAYGTESLPRVDKVVGPGNAYVAEAKRQVYGEVGIDLIAGPSEILVIADGSVPAEWAAMDLFSQAEHDERAQALLLSPSAAHLDAVAEAAARLLPQMPRRAVIEAALAARGALVQVRDLEEACALADRIAPEHLELLVAQPEPLIARLGRAGAIFVGGWTSEAIGDYCAGPNHVLPTAGTARFASPLGVYDFQRRTSLVEVSREAAVALGAIAATLAEGEGLPAHARAARMRIA